MSDEAKFRVDVTDDKISWASNALLFDTHEEAVAYAGDLSARWTAVKAARVVTASTPEREPYDENDERIVVRY